MEKLVYVLWRPSGRSAAAFRGELLGTVADGLREAGARALSVLVADEPAESVVAARITRMDDPVAGLVNVWLDSVDERGRVEALLAPHVSRLAGYLVTESVPRHNTTHRARVGERTPGITMLALLERPERLSREEWLRFWQGHHTPMACEVQCTYLYVRNVVARVLSDDAPPFEGIVEEGFPTEAVTDPMLWYRAEDDPEKLRANMGRMISSVRHFLDIERVESHPMSEYVLIPFPASPDPRLDPTRADA